MGTESAHRPSRAEGGPPGQREKGHPASDGRGAAAAVTVTVYTTGGACVQCAMTIARLKSAGIGHTIINLSDVGQLAARQLVTKELGYIQAPVVRVDGDPERHRSGFRPDLIDLLAERSFTESTRRPARTNAPPTTPLLVTVDDPHTAHPAAVHRR